MTALRKTRREMTPVHPAADLFPMMSEPELRELGEDIQRNGLTSKIAVWMVEPNTSPYVLDGRNRLDALELVGLDPDVHRIEISDIVIGVDPYDYVIATNVHRRHLTAAQRRDLVAKALKAKPEKSDRQIATTTGVSPTTVGKVRAKVERAGDVSKLDTRTDRRGRKQPATKLKATRSGAPSLRDALPTTAGPAGVPTEPSPDLIPNEKMKTAIAAAKRTAIATANGDPAAIKAATAEITKIAKWIGKTKFDAKKKPALVGLSNAAFKLTEAADAVVAAFDEEDKVTRRPWDEEDSAKLSAAERKQLESVLKRREREADESAAEVKAERLANFEEELATIFGAEDEAFREVIAFAEEAVTKAQAEVERRCDEMGIRRAFRPHLRLGWSGRGENVDKERRAELRKAAEARAESDMLKAKKQVRRTFTDAHEQLAIGAFDSEAARAFLAQAPRPEALMPPVRLADLDVAKAKLQARYGLSVPLLAIAAGEDDPSDSDDKDDDFPLRRLR